MAGPRPNNAAAIAGHVSGLRELKAQFQRLPQVVRDNTNEANELTTYAIVARAKARLIASPSIQTRSLLNAVEGKVTKTNGTARVGVTSGQTTMMVAGRTLKVKGFVIAGAGGSALTSQGARIIKPSYYAWHVEYGTSRMKAEPFMGPAAEAERQPHLQRMAIAGKGIERDMAQQGAGLL